MNAGERGFLLLTSRLGDPERNPLTAYQLRTLASRVKQMQKPTAVRELQAEDLIALGYNRTMAQRIVCLLQDENALERYLSRGHLRDCFPISRVSPGYPGIVRQRLGLDAPGCLWAKGDISLLNTPAIALVGSRELAEPNRVFAESVGYAAAEQGITLVSGNARGSDRVAQEACLANGGNVISIVADELQKYPVSSRVLYLSEDSFDLPFTPQRALSRNRVIHTLGYLVLVAQSNMGSGGTWDGTTRNLANNWSPVFCFNDGSAAAMELKQQGATLIRLEDVSDLSALQADMRSLF